MDYILSVACNANATMSPDGKHREAEYGFATLGANGVVTPLGSSGPGGQTFETVTMDGRPPSSLQVCVFMNGDVDVLDADASFVRVSLRPAHDVLPANDLPTSPFPPANATDLLRGLILSSAPTQAGPVDYGIQFGLPLAAYMKQWLFASYHFIGQPGKQRHFEVTIEVVIANTAGKTFYYKVDPEMQIDF